jgi:hypothetical protein
MTLLEEYYVPLLPAQNGIYDDSSPDQSMQERLLCKSHGARVDFAFNPSEEAKFHLINVDVDHHDT